MILVQLTIFAAQLDDFLFELFTSVFLVLQLLDQLLGSQSVNKPSAFVMRLVQGQLDSQRANR